MDVNVTDNQGITKLMPKSKSKSKSNIFIIFYKQKRRRARLSALFITLTFENYERCFLMKF